MTLRRVAICSPLRTPVGKFLGGLSSMNAGQLGAVILKALMERSGIDPTRVDDVVFSQGYGNGEAPAIGHWSWLAAGLPTTTTTSLPPGAMPPAVAIMSVSRTSPVSSG